MPSTTYSLRSDPEVDAALEFLGASEGTRSRVIKEAILYYAAHQRDQQLQGNPEQALRLLVEVEKAYRRVFGSEA